MIASLPMYARPGNRAAHDRFWALIRDGLRERGIGAPDALDHETDHMDVWAREDLVLSHICNLPYRARFRDHVTLIGASDYGLPGCPPGHYNSVFVVRGDNPATDVTDFAASRFVCNDTLSQSGYGAPQLWAQARGFQFRLAAETGAHFESIRRVAKGDADIAAIDAHTWRLAMAEHPDANTLKVIGHTDTSPGQSFITRAGQDPAPYFAAIQSAVASLNAQDAETLSLRSIVALPASAYDLPMPPKPVAFAP